MKQIFIPGGLGSHGQDLIQRGVFTGNSETIIVPQEQKLLLPGNHAIFTPISVTKGVIEDLLRYSGKTQIVSFCGVMNTNPENTLNNVANIHCLFGPGVTGELNAVVTETKNDFSLQIEENLKKLGIQIHTLTPQEHDKKMAIIQALANFCEILLGNHFKDNEEVRKLLSQWKTDSKVIVEMIKLNPYFGEIKEKLLREFNSGGDLADIFIFLADKYLENGDVEKFGTPNFKRVLNFFVHNHGFVKEGNYRI